MKIIYEHIAVKVEILREFRSCYNNVDVSEIS